MSPCHIFQVTRNESIGEGLGLGVRKPESATQLVHCCLKRSVDPGPVSSPPFKFLQLSNHPCSTCFTSCSIKNAYLLGICQILHSDPYFYLTMNTQSFKLQKFCCLSKIEIPFFWLHSVHWSGNIHSFRWCSRPKLMRNSLVWFFFKWTVLPLPLSFLMSLVFD